MQINPYLSFNGNCAEAFAFYAQVLGGEVLAMMTHAGTPMEAHVPPEWVGKIMHARMRVGDSILMASDAPPDRYETPRGFSVTLSPTDPAEAERIFHALADNGVVQMAIQQTFWALRFGALTDRFGTPWMINCEAPA
jgi:PhnB protein